MGVFTLFPAVFSEEEKAGSIGEVCRGTPNLGKAYSGGLYIRAARRARIALIVALLVLGLCSATQPGAQVRASYKTEIVVRTAANVRNRQEVIALVDLSARYGVDVINLAVKQDEDDEVPSGVVFYGSRIAPRAPGYETFDVLAETIHQAHSRGIKVRAWVPQFHDQAAARKNPTWQMQALEGKRVVPFSGRNGREFFVNPLSVEVQAYQRSIVAEIAGSYDVDGIVLDWVRFDDYNMDVGPETRARFREAFGVDPVDIDFKIDNPRRAAWNDWRDAGIGAYVASVRSALEAIKPGIELGVYILPPEFAEVGQNAGLFAGHTDFLSPMAYFKDWGFQPDWLWRELLPQVRTKAGRTPLIPVLDEDWTDAAYREVLPQLRRDFPEIEVLCWFTYGKWTEASFQRLALLRAL